MTPYRVMMTRYRKMQYRDIPDIGLWVITISVRQPAASAEGNLKVRVTKLSSQPERASRAAGPQGPAERSSSRGSGSLSVRRCPARPQGPAERSSSSGSGSPSVCRRPIGPQGPAERSSSSGSSSQSVRRHPAGTGGRAVRSRRAVQRQA